MTDFLALVLAGHLVGDVIVQTDYQANAKARSWTAMAEHMLGYHIALGAIAAHAAPSDPARFWLLVVSLVTHAFIDRRWPVERLLVATRSAGFRDYLAPGFGLIVVDQALHLTILLVTVAAVS